MPSDADRLFARIAIQKSYIGPAEVERANDYVAKLGDMSDKLGFALTLPVILQKLGALTYGQVQAVHREMEAFTFPCGGCGGKGYRLDFDEESPVCERCRQGSQGVAPKGPAAGLPATTPPSGLSPTKLPSGGGGLRAGAPGRGEGVGTKRTMDGGVPRAVSHEVKRKDRAAAFASQMASGPGAPARAGSAPGVPPPAGSPHRSGHDAEKAAAFREKANAASAKGAAPRGAAEASPGKASGRLVDRRAGWFGPGSAGTGPDPGAGAGRGTGAGAGSGANGRRDAGEGKGSGAGTGTGSGPGTGSGSGPNGHGAEREAAKRRRDKEKALYQIEERMRLREMERARERESRAKEKEAKEREPRLKADRDREVREDERRKREANRAFGANGGGGDEVAGGRPGGADVAGGGGPAGDSPRSARSDRLTVGGAGSATVDLPESEFLGRAFRRPNESAAGGGGRGLPRAKGSASSPDAEVQSLAAKLELGLGVPKEPAVAGSGSGGSPSAPTLPAAGLLDRADSSAPAPQKTERLDAHLVRAAAAAREKAKAARAASGGDSAAVAEVGAAALRGSGADALGGPAAELAASDAVSPPDSPTLDSAAGSGGAGMASAPTDPSVTLDSGADVSPGTANGLDPSQNRIVLPFGPNDTGIGDPLVGKVLSGCRLDRIIGRGGMGSVYRARHLKLDRDVAVKVLSPTLTADPKQVAQFFREARSLAKLDHSNIVAIHDVGKEDDIHFIIMQLVDGGSVEQLIRKVGRLSVDRSTRIVEQAAKGLVEAHAKGIVHRDVKPENMLLTADGETVKLTDFGLARMEEGDIAGFTFASGRIVGTPFYMSPEQIDGAHVDSRSDIYSLGATFYYLLAGERPFTGDSPVDILLKHVNEPLVPPRDLRREIPEDLSRAVCKMLAKAPEDRYQSLRDLIRDLEDIRTGETVKIDLVKAEAKEAPIEDVLAAPATLAPLEVVAPTKPRSFWVLSAFLAAAIVLGGGLGLGPIRELLSELRVAADAERPIELEAAHRLKALDRKAAPAARIEKLLAFAKQYDGTRAAKDAGAEVEAVRAGQRSDAETAAKELIERAEGQRRARKHGAALGTLASLPEDKRGLGAEAILEAKAAEVRRELAETRGLAFVPSGKMLQGEAKVPVDLRGFYIELREVSNRDYQRCVEAKKVPPPPSWEGLSAPPPGTEDLPVTGVNLAEAREYAAWRWGRRLPTALEWEKAARGEKGQRFPWGDAYDPSRANARETGVGRLEPVGSRPEGASPYGCLDMAGNAVELAIDRDPGATATLDDRPVAKGGGYGDSLSNCRGAFSLPLDSEDHRHAALGFRCVEDLEP